MIDDCSTDATATVARSFGATVLRPPSNTGSKAGAQSFALPFVRTEFTVAVDADTVLAPDALARLMDAFRDPETAAACGMVLPRHVRTVWERGRYVEYLFAFVFYKPIQDYYGRPLISSGCFSAYRTDVLRAIGGWSCRTLAEDMDLTWSLYREGIGVRFEPAAVCYPVEPHNFHFLRKQLRRWSHGFLQNVRLHARDLIHVPLLRTLVAVGVWDAVISSLAYLFLLPLLAVWVSPWFLLAYLLDAPAVAFPVLVEGARRGEMARTLASIPCFFMLRLVNGYHLLEAAWKEFVLGRSPRVYEKGH